MRFTRTCAAFLLSACSLLAQNTKLSANYDEALVGAYTLPDPLMFPDGKPVRNAKDWHQKRRPQILKLFEDNMHGHSPARPAKPEVRCLRDRNAGVRWPGDAEADHHLLQRRSRWSQS